MMIPEPSEKMIVAATFTSDLVLPSLHYWQKALDLSLQIEISEYNQVFQQLLNPNSPFGKNRQGLNVILIRIQDWSRDFKADMTSARSITEQLATFYHSLVDDFLKALQTFVENAPCFTLLLICPSESTSDATTASSEIYAEIGNTILTNTESLTGFKAFKSHDCHERYQVSDIFDALRDEIAHIPYSTKYYHFLGTLISRFYFSLQRKAHKVIVVDCDNTLWGGVCGEASPDELQLDREFGELQEFLVQQYQAGVLLCLCSKNNEADVWQVFDRRPDMPLKHHHIADRQINWSAKSDNLQSLANRLNLGLDSFIFLDDNPLEIADIQANCPEVLTIQTPATLDEMKALTQHFWIFDQFLTTHEDHKRTQMIQESQQRTAFQQSALTFKEFIEKLNLKITIQPAAEAQMPRVSQLTQRTNQFNFTTIRRTVTEIRQLANDPQYHCLTVNVEDRFGDYGLVGVMIVKKETEDLVLDTFLLSCRVLGRGVEHQMVNELGILAEKEGLSQVKWVFQETPKNSPAKLFFKSLCSPDIDFDQKRITVALSTAQLKEMPFDVAEPTTIVSTATASTAAASTAAVPTAESTETASHQTKQPQSRDSLVSSIYQDKYFPLWRASGNMTQFRQQLDSIPGSSATPNPLQMATPLISNSQETILATVKTIFAEQLSVSETELDAKAPLDTYVHESFKIVEITVALRNEFEGISNTILFEHRTLESISQFIYEQANEGPDTAEAVSEPEQEKSLVDSGLVPLETSLPPQANQEPILDKVTAIFAEQLALSVEDLDVKAPLDAYVNESFKIVEITVALRNEFDGISNTILFEHRTLESISQFIYEQTADEPELYEPEDDTSELTETAPDIVTKTEAAPNPQYLPTLDTVDEEDAIAIIGMNGIYPQAANLEELWELLKNGKSSITEIPEDRWDVDDYFDESGKEPNKGYCKWGGFLDNIDRFENFFFHISPKEAQLMDPQQRLFLEVTTGLLENAGYTSDSIDKKTGVFVGIVSNDYNLLTSPAALQGKSAYRMTDYYQIANRISYFNDFTGPSLSLDTACSGSGTAVHLACESLKRQECQTAIVGGVNIFLHPARFIQYCQMQMLSHDEKCRPFGAHANGTLFGEGIGAILLKPLKQAEKDRDYIYGVIKASSINNGGRTNGFTVPNPQAQAGLIEAALKKANIDSRTISYVEAHGTGTELGDPIEVRGLTMAYERTTELSSKHSSQQYCALGSIKANIGHLESGSAISSIIKVLLQMENQQLVPSLNSQELNPMIPFEDTPFYVQQTLEDWRQPILSIGGKPKIFPRRAGVSSFGAGGSNSHIILEEYPM